MPSITKQHRIAVLYGGRSTERAVSLRSGQNVYDALRRLGYEKVSLIDAQADLLDQLKTQQIEVCFNALHGGEGEDGTIQGLLDWAGLAYTGNGLKASALAMDKAVTKTLLAEAGLSVLPSMTIDWPCSGKATVFDEVRETVGYPLMVKPLGQGSSVGMSKVESEAELEVALEEAGQFESRILLERFMAGRDLTVGVVDVQGKSTVCPILELRSANGWYDAEAKYTEGLTEFILPAKLPPQLTDAIQEATLKAHQALGCHGVSRTDFITDGEQAFYVLEVNTVPGMTDLSDLPAQCQAMSVGYDELVDALLQTASPRLTQPMPVTA